MTSTLVVTNDFPPRPGGIQQFVHGLLERMADDVVVYAPAWKGAAEFDAKQGFEVVRHPTSLMVPEPRVLRRAREIARAHGCTNVVTLTSTKLKDGGESVLKAHIVGSRVQGSLNQQLGAWLAGCAALGLAPAARLVSW